MADFYHCPHPQFTRRGRRPARCRHFFLSQNYKTSIKISAVCTRIVPWNKYNISSGIYSNQSVTHWTDLHLSRTLSFLHFLKDMYSLSILAWIQWKIMNLTLRMLAWYQSLSSLLFLFCKDRASDPQGKSYEARGLIVLFNRSIITISPWLAMQTNYW